MLKLADEKFAPTPQPEGECLTGVGGVKTLSFKVIGEGKGKLDLYYARSWEIQPMIDSEDDVSQYLAMTIPVEGV